jgi:hypothetical protein
MLRIPIDIRGPEIAADHNYNGAVFTPELLKSVAARQRDVCSYDEERRVLLLKEGYKGLIEGQHEYREGVQYIGGLRIIPTE